MVDADEVVAGLKFRGVSVPKLAPPVATTPHGPFGPVVYFPEGDFRAITKEIIKRYRSGTSPWDANQSWWKPATDPNSIEVIDEREAEGREAEARPAH